MKKRFYESEEQKNIYLKGLKKYKNKRLSVKIEVKNNKQ
jgi:hypothetical protein